MVSLTPLLAVLNAVLIAADQSIILGLHPSFIASPLSFCQKRPAGLYSEGCSSTVNICDKNGNMLKLLCPFSTWFDQTVEECRPPSLISACSSVVVSTEEVATAPFSHLVLPPSTCEDLADGFHAVTACSLSVIRCHNRKPSLFECGNGLAFSLADGGCVAMDTVRECQISEEISLRTDDGDCSSDGIFPSSPCSTSFVTCSGGISRVMQCPADLIYDASIQACEYRDNVAECAAENEKEDEDFCTDGFYSGGNCSDSFVACTNNRMIQMRCPANLAFDEARQICDYPLAVPECQKEGSGESSGEISGESSGESSGEFSGQEAELSGEEAELSGEEAELSGEEAESSGEEAESSGQEAESSGEEAESSGEEAESSGEEAEPIEDEDFCADGFYSGGNCSDSFIACTNNRMIQMHCPAKLAFDEARQLCDYPLAVPECQKEGSGEFSGQEAELSGEEAESFGQEAESSGEASGTEGSGTELTDEDYEQESSSSGAELSGEEGESSGQEAEFSGRETELSGEEEELSGEEAELSGEEAELSGEEVESSGQEAELSGEEAESSGQESSGLETESSGSRAQSSGQDAGPSFSEAEPALFDGQTEDDIVVESSQDNFQQSQDAQLIALCADRANGFYSLGCSSQLLSCLDQMPFQLSCPNHLIYNEQKGFCDHPENLAECQRMERDDGLMDYASTPASTTVSFTDLALEDDKKCVFGDDGRKSLGCGQEYLICLGGRAVRALCQDGETIDENSEKCVRVREHFKCAYDESLENNKLEVEGSAETEVSENVSFPCEEEGAFSSEDCMATFIHCTSGTGIRLTCDIGYLFSRTDRVCLPASQIRECLAQNINQ